MRLRKQRRRTCNGEVACRPIGEGAGAAASPRWNTFQAWGRPQGPTQSCARLAAYWQPRFQYAVIFGQVVPTENSRFLFEQ
ncbi:unnamed protein product [Ectocarpus sp. 8 AP-2014]